MNIKFIFYHIVKYYFMIKKVMNKIKPYSNKKIQNLNNILSSLTLPKFQLFDTSLRDGLQTLPIESHELASMDFKLNLYDEIYSRHSPKFIEIGSIVSPKFYPVFNNTIPLIYQLFQKKYDNSGIFVLIPDSKKMYYYLQNNIEHPIHFSFIISFSETFQKKNINKSIQESEHELDKIFSLLQNKHLPYKPILKLYISCFKDCPFDGSIDTNFIVDKIVQYSQLPVNIICLSDTCGTLTAIDIKDIFDKCQARNIDFTKIGIHLHNNNNNNSLNSMHNDIRINSVLEECFQRNILYYDVSIIEHGGCPLAVKNHQLPNLTYDQFFIAINEFLKSSQKK